MAVAYFFILILILLSGLFTSVKSMPFWAQILTYFNPLSYFIESLRFIFLKASSNALFEPEILDSMLLRNFLALIIFAIFFNLWAIFSYKKQS